jgi:hypothetical protein
VPSNFEDVIEEFVQDTWNMPTIELSKKYGHPPRSIRRWRAQAEGRGYSVSRGLIPESQTSNYYEMIPKLTGDRIVIGDLEVPDHDVEMLELALDVARKFEIKSLVINGDFHANDGHGKHVLPLPTELRRGTTTLQEMQTGAEIILGLSEWFEEFLLITGNHDERVYVATMGEVSFGDYLHDLVPGVKITPFWQAYLHSGEEDWLICHQANYTKQPGVVARDIAEIQHINVLAAHTHHLSFSLDKSGNYMCVDGGHCRDVERTLYKQRKMSRYPAWSSGFVMIKNGYPYLFSKTKTDWDFWLQV